MAKVNSFWDCCVLVWPGAWGQGESTLLGLWTLSRWAIPTCAPPAGSELARVSRLQVEHDATHGERLLLAHQE